MARRDAPAAVGGARAARGENDSGVATVWAACAVSALLVLVGLVWALGEVLVSRQRAAGAADLAALAAAGHAVLGEARACARAEDVARAMATRVSECRFRGWDALVVVHADVRVPLGSGVTVTARARAGPVDEVPEVRRTSGGR